jgi:xanthine/CO dehydrogenase XdhC/CoxF family maturation factor
MLFPEGAEPVGMVSGGCLETDLGERAGAVLASGRTETVVYDMRSPDDIVWGLGLGCGGEVRVLLERLAPDAYPGYLEFIAARGRRRRPGVVVTLFECDGETGAAPGDRLLVAPDEAPPPTALRAELLDRVLAGARGALASRRSSVSEFADDAGRVGALIEYLPPPVHLQIFGAGQDAPAVARLARELGWQVTVRDHRPAYARMDRFPASCRVEPLDYGSLTEREWEIDDTTPVVLMTHHFLHDLELLERLLPSAAPYIGLLGPRKRAETLLVELEKRGLRPSPEQLERLHGPLGLDIGAETPEEIAVALVSEIQAVLAGRDGGFLRERGGPLHDWDS